MASGLWLGWVAVLAAITARVFKWHLDYFGSPGPQFHRMALVFMPALALIAWIYAGVRRGRIFRYEPIALAILTVAACLGYEPRASAVTAAFFLASSAAGRFALRVLRMKLENPIDRITMGFGAGTGILIPVLFVVGLLRGFYPGVFLGLIVLPVLVSWRELPGVFRDLRTLLNSWATLADVRHPVAGVAMIFGLVAAVCTLMVMLAPSIAFDSVALHLPSVQYYLAQHALTPVPGIEYSYYPQGMEVVWTLMYALAGQAGARMVSGVFFLAFLLILFRIGRVCGMDSGAAVTGVAFAATLPFLHWTGSVVKNDLTLGLFESLALYAFLRWLETEDFRWIPVGVFFLAEAFGVKHIVIFGAAPLSALFAYAVWRQRQRWKAAGIVVAVALAFGTCWAVRDYLLTGNPVYPDSLRLLTGGSIEYREHSAARTTWFLARIPWRLTFDGRTAFESPLPNPAGILLFAFAPLAVLAGLLHPRSRMTRAQIACTVFAAGNLILWAWFLTKVRYAIFPFALLAMLIAAWVKRFYDATPRGRFVRISLLGVETYCLLIALMGLMIVGINGPQIAYFARRLDGPGYLRAAMHAYGAVEFLNASGGPHPRVFGVDDMARAYASDPPDFDGLACVSQRLCRPEKVLQMVREEGTEYLILPENGWDWKGTLEQLGSPESVYRDAYFTVYDLRTARRPSQ